ncbi:unnamed protein product [Lepidochelys kempii]
MEIKRVWLILVQVFEMYGNDAGSWVAVMQCPCPALEVKTCKCYILDPVKKNPSSCLYCYILRSRLHLGVGDYSLTRCALKPQKTSVCFNSTVSVSEEGEQGS